MRLTKKLQSVVDSTIYELEKNGYLATQKVLKVNKSSTIKEFITSLRDAGVRCAVYESNEHEMELGILKYVALDMRHVLVCFVTNYDREKLSLKLEEAITEFGDRSCSELLNFAQSAFCGIGDPFQRVLKLLEEEKRVLVLNNDQLLYRVFTSTDAFHVLFKSDILFDVSSLPLQEQRDSLSRLLFLPLTYKFKINRREKVPIVACWDSDSILSVLDKFIKSGVTGIPVLDSSKHSTYDQMGQRLPGQEVYTDPEGSCLATCLAVLSVSDFKLLFLDPVKMLGLIPQLTLPILPYLSRVVQIECMKSRHPTIKISEDDTYRY
eukprot:GHVP01056105.1.p1 GENE.GHVP01056105.1~~GHVP01056105.1.p1  ORF type:complete len:322 (+),score=34.29 GHVP01056105.1:1339-2304(+)